MTVPVGAPHPTDPAADPPSAPPEPSVPAVAPDGAARQASAPEIAAAICPYLTSASGSWRSVSPSRDHRCLALAPPAPQTADKQRMHCLSADHVDCSIFEAARDARTTALAGAADPRRIAAADESRRPLPRTAPVLLEPPRLIDQISRLQLERAPGQIALVALMVVAFIVVGVSRLSSGSPADSPAPSFVAVGPSLPASTPSGSAVPTPSVAPSAPSSASPAPSFRTTYKVKKGDTLGAIAAKYKVTVAALRAANGLKSNTIHTGQVLRIP